MGRGLIVVFLFECTYHWYNYLEQWLNCDDHADCPDKKSRKLIGIIINTINITITRNKVCKSCISSEVVYQVIEDRKTLLIIL